MEEKTLISQLDKKVIFLGDGFVTTDAEGSLVRVQLRPLQCIEARSGAGVEMCLD